MYAKNEGCFCNFLVYTFESNQLGKHSFYKGKFSLILALLAGTFGRLLIIFTNSLDTDQDRPNVGPDLDINRLALL